MDKMNFVGIGKHRTGNVPGWCITYLPEDGKAPDDFRHHILPAATFHNYAMELGLDLDADFEKIVDIVVHEAWAGNDRPEDEPVPLMRSMMSPGRQRLAKYEARTERVKQDVEFTGLDRLAQRLESEKLTGVEEFAHDMRVAEELRRRGSVRDVARLELPER